MARASERRQAEGRRATERAKAALKIGDRITATRCGGVLSTYVFDGWEGCWIVSKSGVSDIHPLSVRKVNGAPADFRDPLPTAPSVYVMTDPAHEIARDVAEKLVGAPRSCTGAHAKRYNLVWAAAYAAAVLAREPS